MDLNTSEKFCPVCKNKNAYTAKVCTSCGAQLEDNLTNKVTTTTGSALGNVPAENVESFIDLALIPQGGVGIYAAGSFKPYYLPVDKELILGRKTEASSEESILDLSDLNAFSMGLSRRHAMIRRTDSGFEVLDLASTNGTWLNAERLSPNKPYPFASGSQLRIGRLRLFIVYHMVLKGTRKN
jgi:hypothetical protein